MVPHSQLSWFITPITRTYGRYICSSWDYKPTNITGGHHLDPSCRYCLYESPFLSSLWHLPQVWSCARVGTGSGDLHPSPGVGFSENHVIFWFAFTCTVWGQTQVNYQIQNAQFGKIGTIFSRSGSSCILHLYIVFWKPGKHTCICLCVVLCSCFLHNMWIIVGSTCHVMPKITLWAAQFFFFCDPCGDNWKLFNIDI